MLFHVLPSFTTVELHPVVVAILDVSYVFKSLSKQIPEIVVIGRILKAEVTNVAKVFVEFFCNCMAVSAAASEPGRREETYQDIRHTDL